MDNRDDMLDSIFVIISSYDDAYLREIYTQLTATIH